MKKRKKHLKLCDSDRVAPLWFGWLDWSTWKMALTNDLYEVHKRRSGISLGMNSKRCTDGSEWSDHKKQMNDIHFECEMRDVARVLNEFKQT